MSAPDSANPSPYESNRAVPGPPPYGTPSPYPAPPPQQPAAPAYPPTQSYPGAPPQYGTPPQYSTPPQYGTPGAYGYPLPQAKPSTGTLSWALGFLIFIGIPFVNSIVSGVVMASVYGSVARKGEIARQNARSAANWGLTYLTASIVLILVHVLLLVAFSGRDGMTGFFPLGIPITIYFVLTLLHVVLVIIGTVKASGGKVMRVPFAIPYIRS